MRPVRRTAGGVYDGAVLLADWLPHAWTRTRTARLLAGGLFDGPLPDREIRAEIVDSARLATLRELTTAGRPVGGICRCPGGPTLALYDSDDRILGSATVHGHGRVSWERAGTRDDLETAAPMALALFLYEHGVGNVVGDLLAPLVLELGFHEESEGPQFRPASVPALLAERQVPEVLRDDLLGVAGSHAAELPQDRVSALAEQLAAAETDAVARATVLLNWLGRLPFPTEALWGEGVLVRRLLDTLPEAELVAAAGSGPPVVALGALNWAAHQPENRAVVAAVAPSLRRILP
ncbi:hypothetical protein AB0I61_32185 [Polymorphospora rubra]|uniref:hypothetical protein n=1 Tax=Polymorphospora rubra TaxID=338584 RepID=UPI0033CEBCD6